MRPDGSGWAAFNKAQRAGLLDGWVRAVETPSGGLHLHYPGTDQRNGSLRGQHLDFRGAGGYVLLPPSLGADTSHGLPVRHRGDWPMGVGDLPTPVGGI